jgi:diguanylate cyclase (GGDEF)-like protein
MPGEDSIPDHIMATFLRDQLDFIFFFYGLAFILLGATCSAVAKSRDTSHHWAMLAGFGFVHGIAEWLDLTALIVGDNPAFVAGRTVVMAASFLLLFEFARLEGIKLGLKLPGRWVHAALLFAFTGIAIAKGTIAAGIAVRYTAGFLGALGTSVALASLARVVPGLAKLFVASASAGFLLYAVAGGLIVPSGPFWPSMVVNHDAFISLTAMPIQLVRGLLALLISFSIWAAWNQKLAADVSSSRYSDYVRRQFAWAFVATGVVLFSGWALTEHLGEVYRQNVEKRAAVDIELLASRLSAQTATIDAMVQSLAGSSSVVSLLTARDTGEARAGLSMLDLDVGAAAAQRGTIFSAAGEVVASSPRYDAAPAVSETAPQPDFLNAMIDGPSYRFLISVRSRRLEYHASYPIRAGDRGIVGVAVLSKSLDGFDRDLEDFGRPYFLVDPDGVVAMTNRPDALGRALWSSPATRHTAPGAPAGISSQPPMIRGDVVDATWTDVDGERNFVRRRFAKHSDWSLVILKPSREVFATRLLGIVITLLMAIVGLIYMLTREHRIHDEVLMENRLKLQKLAHDLRVKATTDPLTGLHNRLALSPMLSDEMKRALRYDAPLSLVLFDIDHFKTINDTYGHLTGDQVLVQLSGIVQNLVRSHDLLARWGGEEFLVVLPGSDGQMAWEAAEKLREAIATAAFDRVGTVTCSFGVAQYAPGDGSPELIARADAALYLAKNSGRNQVRLAQLPGRGSVVPLRA